MIYEYRIDNYRSINELYLCYKENVLIDFGIKYNDESKKKYCATFLLLILNNSNINTDIINKIISDSEGYIVVQDNSYVFNTLMVREIPPDQDLEDKNFFSSMNRSRIIWSDFQIYFDLIVKTASKVVTKYNQKKIFSLGQTPAWIVKAAQILKSDGKYGYIPFSGHFYKPIRPEGNDDTCYLPTGESSVKYCANYYNDMTPNILKYRSILTELGLDPRDIIQCEEGQEVVILEFTNTGSGLASFLSLVIDWAKEEHVDIANLLERIEVVILVDRELDIALNEIVLDNTIIKCSHLVASNLPYTSLIWHIANGQDDGNLSDRLVPKYYIYDWLNPPEKITNNDYVSSLEKMLTKAIEDYDLSLNAEKNQHELKKLTLLTNNETNSIALKQEDVYDVIVLGDHEEGE